MKIVLITQGVSRLVHPLLESDHDVVGIIESAARNYGKSNNLCFDLISSIKNKIFKPRVTLKELAKRKNIPYFLFCNNTDQQLSQWLVQKDADLCVVFSMSRLLKKEIFSIPKHGTINLHPSFLPEYRGPNPDFWQYHDCELSPGVTVHFVDEGEDTGGIICQQRGEVELGIKSTEILGEKAFLCFNSFICCHFFNGYCQHVFSC